MQTVSAAAARADHPPVCPQARPDDGAGLVLRPFKQGSRSKLVQARGTLAHKRAPLVSARCFAQTQLLLLNRSSVE